MDIVSATTTRRDVLAKNPTGFAVVAASDMTLRIPVAARDLSYWLRNALTGSSRIALHPGTRHPSPPARDSTTARSTRIRENRGTG